MDGLAKDVKYIQMSIGVERWSFDLMHIKYVYSISTRNVAYKFMWVCIFKDYQQEVHNMKSTTFYDREYKMHKMSNCFQFLKNISSSSETV